MRALFLFNVDFAAWPLAIRAALAEKTRDLQVTGVTVLDSTVHAFVSRAADGRIAPLYDLARLEPEWTDDEEGGAALDHYERLLGADTVARVELADRVLSHHLVGGATMPRSPLSDLARDPMRRRNYLGGLFKFLDELFGQGKFDFVFSFSPQDAPSVAAGFMARHHGVPFLHPRAVGFHAKTNLCDDIAGMSPVFRHDLAHDAGAKDPLAPFLAEARRVLTDFRARPVPPSYMSVADASAFQRPDVTTLAALLYRWMTRRPPEALRYPYPLSRLRWEVLRWLRARRDARSDWFQATQAPAAPFAYFPLHYEPEASTMVAAPHATDQVAMIERLSKFSPADWSIAVKEHLPMLGRRPPGFYRRLAAIPKVTLVSPRASSFGLIKAAKLTVTITGTAGLEAVLLGRPALFLGPSPIQLVKRGFVVCGDLASLSADIERALAMPPLDDASAYRFIAALTAQGVDFPAKLLWGGPGVVTQERVAAHADISERLADLILAALAARPCALEPAP